MFENSQCKEVVYLIGAGATQGCVDYVGSARKLLMNSLTPKLSEEIRSQQTPTSLQDNRLVDLLNSVFSEETNIEHVITFLDESTSIHHRDFADSLRKVFEKVLRQELNSVKDENPDDFCKLYKALLHMHEIQGVQEELKAILTINYDDLIENAVNQIHTNPIDYGVKISETVPENQGLRLLKLHGSFNWGDKWPITEDSEDAALWIPPGIFKNKDRYPFNVLWGLAREVLDCDLLRIIGCRLSSSDWDLISLLFTTRHSNARRRPYMIEVIDSPIHAEKLKNEYPYLDIRSILEIEEYQIGNQYVGDLLFEAPQAYNSLTPEQQKRVMDTSKSDKNWFRIWLIYMAEAMYSDPNIDPSEIESGVFGELLGV